MLGGGVKVRFYLFTDNFFPSVLCCMNIQASGIKHIYSALVLLGTTLCFSLNLDVTRL